MYYIGLDIHKKDTQICVLNEDGALVCNERIPTDVFDIGLFFKKMETNDDELKVVMEATGFYFWIYDVIVARGHDVMIVHPTKVKPMMKGAKNDKNDAFALARLLRLDEVESIYVPSKEVREMRELTRHRGSLVRKRGDLKREILAHLLQNNVKAPKECCSNFTKKHIAWMRSLHDFVLDEKLDLLETVNEKIKNVEKTIEERYGTDEETKLMRTVPGIGLVTASVIKAEIGDITRFSSSKDLAAYVGLTPITYQSGEKEWGGHTRPGNSRIKHVLIEAMLFHFHNCPGSRISQYYSKKKDAIGNKRAMVAGGRKLVEAIYFMLVRKQEFHAH